VLEDVPSSNVKKDDEGIIVSMGGDDDGIEANIELDEDCYDLVSGDCFRTVPIKFLEVTLSDHELQAG
jgi:hypothetical protein